MGLQLQTDLDNVERCYAEATNESRDTTSDNDLLFCALNR
jgi:hypothetical protein